MSQLDPDQYKYWAFDLGLQYYGAGRFSAASNFIPVSANLLHHAVEMFLKGCLAPRIGIAALRAFSHNLEELWKSFRQNFLDPSLDRFDSLICELHKFEQIRYPETLLKKGGFFSVGFPSGARNVQLSGPKLPEYQLSVDDVDILIKQLFTLGKVNAKAFSILQHEHAATYFSFRNQSPLV